MEEYLTSKAMISNFEQLKRIFRFFIWLNSRLLLDILKVNRLKDISVIGEGLCTVLPLTARMYSSVNWCAEHIAQRWGGLTVLPLTARIYSSVNCCAEHIAQRWGGLTTAIDCKNIQQCELLCWTHCTKVRWPDYCHWLQECNQGFVLRN